MRIAFLLAVTALFCVMLIHADDLGNEDSLQGIFQDTSWVSNADIFYNHWLDFKDVLRESSTASAAADPAIIDFEIPNLGGLASMVIDPYVDAATGVVFTSPISNAQVGLVKNRSTSACVYPPDDNQKLGTGPISSSNAGLSGYPMQAMFPMPLTPPVTVSAEYQLLSGWPIRLSLFDSLGVPVSVVTATSGPPGGVCYPPGDPRARTVVTATSDDPVAYAVMEQLSNAVLVIDNFSFSSGDEPAAIIQPETLHVFSANAVDPFELTAYTGGFTDGHTTGDVNTATLTINSTTFPISASIIPSFPGFSGDVLAIVFTADDFLGTYGYPFDITDQAFTVSGEYTDGEYFIATGGFVLVGHKSGDANGDGHVNVGDAVFLICYIFASGPAPEPRFIGDVNGDSRVDVGDAVYMINYIFKGGTPPVINAENY